jgi:hypothetical protein
MPKILLSNITREEIHEVQQFLLRIFAMEEVNAGMQQNTLEWKSLGPHPWWPEGLSYALRADGHLIAHGTMAPVRFCWDGGTVESGQIIDWAADNSVPGAGMLLYRECLNRRGGTLLAIGGSDDAQKVIPRIKWFSAKPEIQHYVRPVRPWKYWDGSARSVARALRGLYRKWKMGALPPAGGWRCRPARPGDDVFQNTGDFVAMQRTRAWFDYLRACPAVASELFILEKEGTAGGHAFVSYFRDCARIADFVAPVEAPAAFSALLRHLAAQPGIAEIRAASSLRETTEVFTACGMRWHFNEKVWVADPKKCLPETARWEITMAVGDTYYRWAS